VTKQRLRLFLDEGVPASVGREFSDSGHDVIYLKDCIATGSPDDLVCVAAEQNEAILVACDGDMKQLVKRFGIGTSRFAKLSLIKLSVNSPQCAPRIRQAMSLIEHEWNVSEGKSTRRLYIEIKSDVIRTYR
jgi:predicted nuclease of predicted toxin-antitoxin system